MDPVDVLRTLWKERYWALPVVLLTMVAGCYAYGFRSAHLRDGRQLRGHRSDAAQR
jgi:hypothetical protein